jgi:hypothetical protein
MPPTNQSKDFFVSYNSADASWAEWIAWILEENHYSVKIQAWDFLPGNNFVLEMDEAAAGCRRTIAVLSDNYLQSKYAPSEWAAAFKQDPQSTDSILIPIRVGDCKPSGLLGQINYIDIVGKDESDAENSILEGIAAALKKRGKPSTRPTFPQASNNTSSPDEEASPPNDSDSTRLNRASLFDLLSALTVQEFDRLVFVLQPPAGIVPAQVAPQGSRVAALLSWAESPSGRGLDEIHGLLNELIQDNERTVPEKRTFPGPAQTSNPFLPLTGAVEDPQQFFDCEHTLDRIFEVLNSGSSVAVIGDRNMGKSSILRAVHRLTPERLQRQRQPILLNLTRIYSEADFYSALCEKVGIPPCSGREMDKALSRQRLLLVLDEVERISQEEFSRRVREQLRGLAEDSDAPLKLVVAARIPLDRLFPDGYDDGMVSPLEGICLEEFIKPWSPDAIRAFIDSRLAQTPVRFSATEIDRLISDCQGKPKQLMQLCNELYREKQR